MGEEWVLRLTKSFACLLACSAAAGVSAQGAQAATQTTKLRSVSSPPSTALAPGADLTVKGQVTNRSRKRAKARVTLTLRTSKSAKAIKLTAKSTSAIKAGKTARYSVKVKLPASLKDGSYYVRACATAQRRR